MKPIRCAVALAVASLVLLSAGTPAFAGFGGQTILGPLVPGSSVTGNTIGASDDNDGFTSGDHIFEIWNGPDDVWQLDWPGGPLTVMLTHADPTAIDLDLFLYAPGSYDDSGNYSILNTGIEVVIDPDAPAGIYYLNVDSDTAAHAGAYTLSVSAIPEPAGLALLALAAPLVMRRRRR